ncbi:MAG: hypothetical protein JXD22_12030, partial [Sedimentisphaerales bacterium]|nr:hypothetical protein [Sedimentisphaerales bacterium]
ILGKMDGQHWQELAAKEVDCKENTTYHLKVVAKGDTIKFFVNDTLVIELSDNTYPEGFAGLRVVDTHAEFDNIDITAK